MTEFQDRGVPAARTHTRRAFLGAAAALGGLALAAPAEAAARFADPPRTLSLMQMYTGERLKLTYWSRGRYDRAALRRIDWLLRDFHNDRVHRIDPRLLDLLHGMQRRLGTRKPFVVLSGYRSPATNLKLASEIDGVSRSSFHLDGMAVDICMEGCSVGHLRSAAASFRAGGVGYYPDHGFVHVDVGPVRHW